MKCKLGWRGEGAGLIKMLRGIVHGNGPRGGLCGWRLVGKAGQTLAPMNLKAY